MKKDKEKKEEKEEKKENNKENKEENNDKEPKAKFLTEEEKQKALLDSEKLKKRERNIRRLKIYLLVILLFLIIIYFLLRLFYEGGSFTVALDDELAKKSGLVMYERLEEKDTRKILKVDELAYMDNISINWLPNNLDKQGEGTHNGENYMAYTFYVENKGAETINYWYKIITDDVIKNVDRAIRIMLYRNGEPTVYAKRSERTGQPERDTKPFIDDVVILEEQRKDFKVGDIDRFTIVIWIEGDDPDCVDLLIGGMMKMHMDIMEEHIKN